MTPTEKKYMQRVGKLYWSKNRHSLVIIESLSKKEYSKKWNYSVFYMNEDVQPQTRNIACARIGILMRAKNWIPADEYIADQPTHVK